MKSRIAVTVLRMLIGWHFLYEGLAKLVQPGGWSSAGYLRMSRGFAAPVFRALADSPELLRICDALNMGGLTLVGLALLIGVAVRPAAACGIAMLALYTLAHPPHPADVAMGHVLWIDRNVVEAAALAVVIALPSIEWGAGLATWLRGRVRNAAATDSAPVSKDRRDLLLRLGSIPALGVFAWAFVRRHGPVWERENLKERVDAVTGATVKAFDFDDIRELKKPLDAVGRIGSVRLSRMILGGNLIGGWAHARDLLYADKLVKAYHTDARIFRTFRLAEQCGINAVLTNPALMRVINEYWKREGGRIQFISDCGGFKEDLVRGAEASVEHGACAVYTHGGVSDRWAQRGQFEKIGEALAAMRKLGVPSGIGAHRLETVQGCVERGILPDFWMKTLHTSNYWSAHPEAGYHSNDNLWCLNAEEVIAFMKTLEQPWIAFKILAAGAIRPQQAFPYAFHGGADFICVGMYDFQLVEDVNLVTAVLDGPLDRPRPWRA